MRGHEVLHLYFESFQAPRGNVARAPRDPPSFSIEGLRFDRPFSKYKLIRRRWDEGRYGRMAASRIAAFRPDVLLANSTPIDVQCVIDRECKAKGIPVVFWLQDIYSIAMRSILKRKSIPFASAIANYYERLERRLICESQALVCISPDFEGIMAGWGVRPERCFTIENWASRDEVLPAPQDNPWSRAEGVAGKFVFLYSGTIGMKHNPGMLLALADAFAERDDVVIVVISSGLGADWLRERPRANLRVLPLQPFEVLGQALSSASVLVALLAEESGEYSVPSKVLTYHCVGKPLLLAVPSSNLAARIVSQNGTGLVVPPDSPSEFTAAAKRLYADEALRREAGVRASRYAAETFDIEKIADRFEGILSGACK